MLSVKKPAKPVARTHTRAPDSVVATVKLPASKYRRLISPWKKIIAMLRRRKWLIIMTMLFTLLTLLISALLARPVNITLDTVLLTGILLGLLLGTLIASYYEWRRSLLISAETLEEETGLPVVGVIPEMNRGEVFVGNIISQEPHSSVAEAYRIAAALLLHGRLKTTDNVLMVTSLDLKDGKTVTAVNLAYCVAELDAKVLLIDADLRKPTAHRKMGMVNKFGLINFLRSKKNLTAVTQQSPVMSNLYVITAGSALKFSAPNLLSSKRMVSLLENARKYFDYVIIDAPPVTGFADTLLLHSLASLTLFVVPEKRAEVEEIKRASELLKRIKPSLAGAIKVKARRDIIDKGYYKTYADNTHKAGFEMQRRRKINLGIKK